MAWLLISTLAFADPEPAPPFGGLQDIQRDVSELCFPSGLRVTVLPDHRQPVVAVTSVFGVGSGDDPEGKRGTAHLLEHLWFQADAGGQTVATRMQQWGMQANAYTLEDATAYITLADVQHLDEVMRLEGIRLVDPLVGVDAEAIDQERRIVQSEQVLRGIVTNDYPNLLPDGFAPSGRNTDLPSQDSVAAIETDDLAQIARDYRPQNASLLIAGDVDADTVRQAIEAQMPDMAVFPPGAPVGCESATQNAPVSPPTPPSGRPPARGLAVREPVLVIGWAWPAAYGQDDPIMQITARLAADHLRDALKALENDDLSGECVWSPGAERSSLVCWVNVPVGVSAESLLQTARESLAVTDILEDAAEDVERYVLQGITSLILGLDDTSALSNPDALNDALSNHFSGEPNWFSDAMRGYNDLTAEAVQAFGAEWMSEDLAWVTLLTPPDVVADEVWAGRHPVRAPEASPDAPFRNVQPPPHHAVYQPLDDAADRPEPSSPRPLFVDTMLMRNGMRMVAVHHGDVPVSYTGLLVHGAVSTEPSLGINAWTRESTGFDWSAFPDSSPELAAAGYVGQFWESRVGDAEMIAVAGSSDMLDGHLWTLSVVAQERGYMKPASVKSARRRMRDGAKKQAQQPAVRVTSAGLSYVLGRRNPHVYTQSMLAARASKRSMVEADWHRVSLWRPSNATLVTVGPLSARAALLKGRHWFSDWNAPYLPTLDPSFALPRAPVQPRAFVETDADRTTTSLQVVCRVDETGPGAVGRVGAEVLRAWAWSNLRESDIAAYSPNAGVWWAGDAQVAWMAADVAHADAGTAAGVLRDGLEYVEREVSSSDVEQAVWRLRSEWVSELVTVSDVFGLTLGLHQYANDYVDEYVESLAEVSADDIRDWASGCSRGAALMVLGEDPNALDGSVWEERVSRVRTPRVP